MSYRRARDSETWHWSPSCTGWPKGDHHESPTMPYYGHLCCECQGKEERETSSDERGRHHGQGALPFRQEMLTARELELLREDMRRWGERMRGDLERLEALLVMARDRERKSAASSKGTSARTPREG